MLCIRWVREKKKDTYIRIIISWLCHFINKIESSVPQAHIERGLIVSKESNLLVILLVVEREFDAVMHMTELLHNCNI